MRKVIILFLLTFTFSESFAQLGWVLQNSETTNNLLGISTFDGINAVAVGEKGTVTITGNEGKPSWNRQQNVTKTNLNGVTSISAKILLVVGPRDSIYRSVDRGLTWNRVRSKVRGECWTIDNISRLSSIDFDSSSGLAVAVGDGSEVVFSEDSGMKWEERLPTNSATNLKCVSLCKGNVLSGGDPLHTSDITQFVVTTDQGDDWLINSTDQAGISKPMGITLYGCDLKAWILVGDAGHIYHSKTHGLTWDSIPSGTMVTLNAVRFSPDSLYGYIAGDSGMILMSNDGGYNWSREYPPTKQNLHSVALVDPFHVYICGDSGTILWTQDGGFSGVSSQSGELAMDIQTYPNPLSSKTTIKIFLNERRQVNLQIFNPLGVEVATIANGIYEAGSHSFEWNAIDIPSGVYFCRLVSLGQHIFSRMVVSK